MVCQKRIGVYIGKVLILVLCFTDDIVILTSSEKSLQEVLDEMKNIFIDYNWRIYAAKTKTLCATKNITNINVTLENKKIY